MTDFYTIETPPPSSSTSKDSMDDGMLTSTSLHRLKPLSDPFPHSILSKTIPSRPRTDEHKHVRDPHRHFLKKRRRSFSSKMESARRMFDSPACDEVQTPLRRSLGNTKLKTRQDVRRFRKFLKRNHDLSSISLIDIEPDAMRNYLIDYLTSIRTRKGLKYDPETLRSYYLSIQRYLKDSNYPYCLRNSPHFAPCRDLIIQMRKEKNQIKVNDLSSCSKGTMKKNATIRKLTTPVNANPSLAKTETRMNSTDSLISISSNTYVNLLPSSSLPPRKRQQMKYFLESRFSCDLLLLSSTPRVPSPTLSSLSSDAYSILIQFTTSTSTCSSPSRVDHLENLLDQSPACGKAQRLMLTSLCHQWTGDIRVIHANLRPEVNSFLPHILVLNILSSKYS